MKIIRKFFPLSFKTKENHAGSLINCILWYAGVILLYFAGSALLGWWLGNVVAWLLGIFGIFVGTYNTGGIVLSVLCYWGKIN